MTTFEFTGKNWKQAAGSAAFALLTVAMALQQPFWWLCVGFWTCCFVLSIYQRKGWVNELVLDEVGITRHFGLGGNPMAVESVAWNDVQRILIETTDAGPWGEDFFFVICGQGRNGVVVGNDLAVAQGLLDELQRRFMGINNEMIIQASGCTVNQMFPIWARDDCLERQQEAAGA